MTNIRTATIDDVQTISLIHALSWKEAYKNNLSQQFLSSIQNDRWVPLFTRIEVFSPVRKDYLPDNETIGDGFKMLSPCGVKCHECKDYNQTCQGCRAIEGQVYWAQYVGQTICPIFQCCTAEKQHKHCGECKQLPCQIYYDTQDPSTSIEEHEAGIKLRVSLLKDLKTV